MFCSKCGANVEEGKAFCGACGQPISGYSISHPAAPVSPEPGAIPAATRGYAPAAAPGWQAPAGQPAAAYAGFWLRLVAAIIDGIIVSIPTVPIFFALFLSSFRNLQSRQDPTMVWTVLGPKIMFALIISLFASWLYWGLFESSAWQATLGKKALGLVVTDLEGQRISFARASGRFFAGRGVSCVPYLGSLYFLIDCICVGFTARKQAVHDMIASCLVLRKL